MASLADAALARIMAMERELADLEAQDDDDVLLAGSWNRSATAAAKLYGGRAPGGGLDQYGMPSPVHYRGGQGRGNGKGKGNGNANANANGADGATPGSADGGTDAAETYSPPTLAELAVRSIGTNLHMYSCLRGLPAFLSEQVLAAMKEVFGTPGEGRLDDDKVSNWLDLELEAMEQRGLPLTVINAPWSGLGDEGLRVIGEKCSRLRDLDLSFCEGVGDEGLAAVARACPDLRSLSLTHCRRITDEGVTRIIAHCPLLESVCLEMTTITDLSVQTVARRCKALACFNVGGCKSVTNVGIGILGKHCGRTLVSLNLGGCALTEFDMEDIAATCFHTLEELVLRACRLLGREAARHIGVLCKRQQKRRPMTAGGAHAGGLRLLDVGGCGLMDDASVWSMVQHAKGLRTLDLRGLPITDAGVIRTCIRATCLETLVVSRCRNVTDECVGTLKGRFGNLRRVQWKGEDGVGGGDDGGGGGGNRDGGGGGGRGRDSGGGSDGSGNSGARGGGGGGGAESKWGRK